LRANWATALSAAHPAAAPNPADPSDTAICSRRSRRIKDGANDPARAIAAM
jgi:hypothetical protein